MSARHAGRQRRTARPGDPGLVGGTLTVIYADGRTEKRTFDPGGVYYLEPEAVANYLRNDGTSEVKVYFVVLK